jgi:hypothetical protein
MSNNRENIWEDEDEDDVSFETQFDTDTDLVKKLRKALKAEQRRSKELETNYSELTKAQKERILKDALASRGVNPKVAAFVPSDIEASEDAIAAWLDNNADVFGIPSKETKSVNNQDIDSLKKMDNVLTGLESPGTSNDLERKLASATSEEEIMSLLSGNL